MSLLIVGAGGHGRAVADVAAAAGFTVAGFTDCERDPSRREILGRDDDIDTIVRTRGIKGLVIGVGNTAMARRAELFARLAALGVPLPAVVHPRATVSPTASVGAGAVVFANAVLGAGVVIGDNAVVYSGAIVEHGGRLGRHAYLSPGAVVSGDVTVDEGAFVGAGAVVVPGVTIGAGAVVAAGAVVLESVAPGATVVGVPARALPRGGAPR